MNVEFEDLCIIKELGAGQFGLVYLVKSANLEIPFALKVISKSKVVKENLEKYLIVQFRFTLAREICNGSRQSPFHHAIFQVF